MLDALGSSQSYRWFPEEMAVHHLSFHFRTISVQELYKTETNLLILMDFLCKIGVCFAK